MKTTANLKVIQNVYGAKTIKKTALLLLLSVGLAPVLLSSCSSAGSTAGNRAGSSYVKATAGSNGVQWYGGNPPAGEKEFRSNAQENIKRTDQIWEGAWWSRPNSS